MTDYRADIARLTTLIENTLRSRAVNASFIERRRVLLHDLPDFAAQMRGGPIPEPETE